jgi:hypothetical protein
MTLLVKFVGLLDVDAGGEKKDELSHLPGAESAPLNGFPRGYPRRVSTVLLHAPVKLGKMLAWILNTLEARYGEGNCTSVVVDDDVSDLPDFP